MAIIKDGRSGGTNQLGVDATSRGIVGLYDNTGNPVTSSNPLPVALTAASTVVTPVADVLSIATQNITTADTASTTSSQFNNQSVITGTPTAGSVASFAVNTVETIHVQVTGTWVGTLVSEFTIDNGVHWVRQSLRISGTATTVSTFTSNLVGIGVAAGKTQWRLRASAWSSGTATVLITTSLLPVAHYVVNPLSLTDGTASITATIKAASTATLTTDTALVVGLSPNAPLPAGTNVVGAVTQSGTWNAAVSNFPATQAVSVAALPALAAGSNSIGSVTVNGLSTPKSTQQSITTTASQLAPTALTGRVTMIVTAVQTNTQPVYLGATGVTTATGTPIYPGQSFSCDLNAAAALYAITPSGTQTVAVFEAAP